MDLITTPVVFGQSPPENSIVHSTSVSLTNRSPSEPVHLVQYDDKLPLVAVALTSNSQPYTVPSGAAVNVRLAKPDGHYVYDPAYGVSDDGQTVYIAVTVQMTAVSGKISPIIEVVVNGTVAGTGFFVLDIDPNPIPEDAIESTDEYKTIQQLAEEVTQAAQIVQDNAEGIQYVQENAANITAVAQNGENISAVGESIANVNTVAENLTPIQTAADNIAAIQQAPASASAAAASATLSESWAVGGTGSREGEDTNNAKYYCEQAQSVAQGQLGWYATPQDLQAAHPTGQNGQWAIIGTTDTIWTWDSDTSAWINTGSQIDLSNYYQKAEADQRFQMPVGFYFDWAPVSGGPDLSTAQKVASYFGYGTWKEISGVFMLSRSSSHAVGSTGGEENHTLTTNEIPSHNHVFASTYGGTTQFDAWYLKIEGTQQSTPFEAYGEKTQRTGGGASHNNMPPYLTCYRWQRIA